jgi:hypothetical protein
MKSFGEKSMLGSPNLHRGNAPLAMRLRIDDLNAQLAPLDRYGVAGLSSAMADTVRALARGLQSALRGALCFGLSCGRNCEAT